MSLDNFNLHENKTIGNKNTDNYNSDSIYGKVTALEEHIHNSSNVYPTLADGVVITADASAWTLGSITEIIPASTITDYFDLHWLVVEAVSANDIYELVLYSGPALSETEIARVKFVKNTTAGSGAISIPVQTAIISSNSRISAALASKSGGSDTATVSLGYHIY